MEKIRTIVLLIFLTLVASFDSAARSYEPSEIPEPNLMAGEFIADPGNLLSPSTKSAVNQRLKMVRDQSTSEVGVAIVPDLGDMEVEDFANRLYDRWKVGKADKDNGVLLIISPESRQARIQTGYGAEGVLPDAVVDGIMRHQIIPNMRNGDLDAAVTESTAEIARVLTDPKNADELRSSQTGYGSGDDLLTPSEKEALKSTFSVLCVIVFIVGGVVLGLIWYNNRKKPRQQKVLSYRNMFWILIVLGVASLGLGLVWALIGWFLLRKARNTSDACPNCGNSRMKHLTGLEASQFLTPAQQTEVRLKSRTHDVWKCARCGQTTVDSFDNPFSTYSRCDKCGTKAMHVVRTDTLRHPTTFRGGEGQRVYRCEHCGHERRERFTIPARGRNAAIAGAALGAGRRSGGFSGGGFGGFGGGISGGGGASGRW